MPEEERVCVVNLLTIDHAVRTVSVIVKVFEYCIVKRLCTYVKLHDLQFGFTKGGGCNKAFLVFKIIVEYFNKHGSNVYVSALDITKVYDRLNQYISILKLSDIGIPRYIIMIFMF